MWGLQSTAVHVYSQRSDLVPLHPTSLTHKNPQRRKLIYGMCPAGHKQQSINLFEDFLVEYIMYPVRVTSVAVV